MWGKSVKFLVTTTALIFYSVLAHSAYELNLQTPETAIADSIYSLHTLILVICLVIFFVVFGAMFYAIFKHRKSLGHKAEQFHENTMVEIIWTVIPILILVGMAWPATKTILKMKDTSASDMTIKVTGYQWKWNYDYLQDGFNFYSTLSTPYEQIYGNKTKGENYLLEVDNPMVVPVGKKVRIILTAADVIHAWWVPAFGVKQDAIPGFVRDTWIKVDKPGIYRGQCAELCGKDHGFMPIVVEVKSAEDYTKWAQAQKAKSATASDDPNKTYTLEELRGRGEKVYAANCVACHQANGMGIPGTFPALSGSKIVTGKKDEHISTVINGRPRTAMPSFKQLSDVEIAAVVTYERNAWNNKTGQVIQPSEVKAFRK
jgi:cytochrome c oxidase subunit 2